MANLNGKFLINKFKGTKMNLFVHLDSEWLKYADGDAQSYTIIVAVPIDYDEETGVLTLQNDKGQVFYIGEWFVQMFWEADSGFKLTENTTSTLHPGTHKLKKRDIM